MTTVESSFSADAVIAKLVFEDDFERTVAQGLGGGWTWVNYDSVTGSAALENVYVDGSTAVLPAQSYNGNDNYESFSGMPFPSSGIAQFDFLTPTVDGLGPGRPTFGLVFTSTKLEPVDVYVWVSNGEPRKWWIGSSYVGLFSAEFGFDPDPSTWYTAQVRYTTDRTLVEYRVWKRGDPEPVDPTVSGDLSGQGVWGRVPFLDFYWPAGNLEEFRVDNVKVWATAYDPPGGDFTANAWIVLRGGSWTADAIKRTTVVRDGKQSTVATIVGSREVSSWSPTNGLTINVPTGTQTGDTLLLTAWTDNDAYHHAVDLVSGGLWQQVYNIDFNTYSTYPSLRVWTRVVQAGDPTSYTVSCTPNTVGFGLTLVTLRNTGSRLLTGSIRTKSDADYSQVPTFSETAPAAGTAVAIFLSSTYGASHYTMPNGMTLAVESPSFYFQQAVGIAPVTSGQIVQYTATVDQPDAGSPFRAAAIVFFGSGSGISLDAVFADVPPPPIPYNHTITISLNDVDITDDVLLEEAQFLSQASGSPGTCLFKVKDPGKRYSFKMGDRLTLDIDGKRYWGGWVQTVKRGYFFPYTGSQQGITYQQLVNAPRLFIIEGVDYNILFRKRILYDKVHPERAELKSWPAGTLDSAMIAYLCSNNLDLSGDDIDYSTMVQTVGSPNPDKRGNPAGGGWQWGDGMRSIARYPGAIWYIDPDKRLVYADVDTPTSHWYLTDDPSNGGWNIGYRDVEILHNGSNLRNDAMVWGVGQGSKYVKFRRTRDTDSINAHGLWQVGDFRGDLWRQSSVDKRSNSFVYGSPQNKRGGKDDAVSVQLTLFKPILRVAEKVNFTSNVFGFSDVIPVRRSMITFPNPTQAKFQLTLSHEIDEPWNTFEFWFPPIPKPDINVPIDTSDVYCPVLNPPVTFTPDGGETIDLGSRFQVVYSGTTAAIGIIDPPLSGDYEFIMALDYTNVGTNANTVLMPTNDGTQASFNPYIRYITLTTSPKGGGAVRTVTKTIGSSEPWYITREPIYVRYCYFRGLYHAIKVWRQSVVEPSGWTLTQTFDDGFSGMALNFPSLIPPSGLVVRAITIAATPTPAISSAMPIGGTVRSSIYSVQQSTSGFLASAAGAWSHSWPFSDPGDGGSYPINWGTYSNDPITNAVPEYGASAVWGVWGPYDYPRPSGASQRTAAVDVTKMTVSSHVLEQRLTEPTVIRVSGTVSAGIGRSGGLASDRASYPSYHNVSITFTVYPYANDSDELFWNEWYALGRDVLTVMISGIHSESSGSVPFSFDVPYHEFASTEGTSRDPGYFRWGIKIIDPFGELAKMSPGGGPFMLPNTASISASASCITYASYPMVPNGSHFCLPDNGAAVVADERVCETYSLNEPQFGPWVIQLNKVFVPGSVTVTAEGQLMRPGIDFTEAIDGDRQSITYLHEFTGVTHLYVCYVPLRVNPLGANTGAR